MMFEKRVVRGSTYAAIP